MQPSTDGLTGIHQSSSRILENGENQSAVDRFGQPVDFLLTARRFLSQAISSFGPPKKITVDKNGANFSALACYNHDTDSKIGIRQIKCLNNIVEQDHRAIKRIIRPMMGFKSFWYAANTIAGIELIPMLRKGQMGENSALLLHQQFELLAT